jgi:uncharacterized protein YuzE
VDNSPKVEFDVDANAAYVRLGTGRVKKTREGKVESLDVLFDYGEKGQLVGLEILNLKRAVELFVKPKIPEILATAEESSK